MIKVYTNKHKEQYQLAYILFTIAYNVFFLFIWCAQLGTSFKGGGGVLNVNIWQCRVAQCTNRRSTELFDSRCTLHLSLKLSCLYMMFINYFFGCL
jgi:hypothetical protein